MLTQVPQRWLDRHPKSEPCPSPKDDGEVRCFWSLVIAPALYPALLQVYPSLQIRLYHRLFTSRAFGSANLCSMALRNSQLRGTASSVNARAPSISRLFMSICYASRPCLFCGLERDQVLVVEKKFLGICVHPSELCHSLRCQTGGLWQGFKNEYAELRFSICIPSLLKTATLVLACVEQTTMLAKSLSDFPFCTAYIDHTRGKALYCVDDCFHSGFPSLAVNRCRALVDGLSFRHRLVVTPSLA